MTLHSTYKYSSFAALTLLTIACLSGCQSSIAPIYSPEDAHQQFVLADEDLEIRLVASEPLVQDPVAMCFDASGHLWVVEMLGFMPDIDGKGEEIPNGRISVLFDENKDGRMDGKKIFLDSLHLPRAIAVVPGGVLVAEQMPLWFVTDTDGDFRADKKILVDSNYGGLPLPEHSANGLWRGLDGWIYNAKSKSRYKMMDDQWREEETEFRGQWGICHDNEGRLFYNYNWSQLHADLVPPNYLSRNPNHKSSSGIDHGLTLERKVFPVRSNPAVNRGYVPGTLDKEGKLLEFASACAPFVYRGNLLPEEYHGNAFVCEPTANLMVRNTISENGIHLAAYPAYQGKDFLTSYDERFRPIFLADGPDGALYFVDMYRGIIQHGPYMSEYLREITLQRGLDRHINLGRIWKVVPKNHKAKQGIDLTALSDTALVSQLDSDNGWLRDAAQDLLTHRDGEVLFDLVREIALRGESVYGKLQARWLLAEWKLLTNISIAKLLQSTEPIVRANTIRLLANADLSKTQKQQFQASMLTIFPNSDPKVQLQIVLHAQVLPEEKFLPILMHYLKAYCIDPVARDAALSSAFGREHLLLNEMILDTVHWQVYAQERAILLEMLAAAVVNHGVALQLENLMSQMMHQYGQEFFFW